MKLRKATRIDLDRLTAIHLVAYPDARSVEARERNFTQNPYGSLDDLVVIEDRGLVVGHAFLFRFRGAFGGRSVKVGGIASVGVAPEARGRGVATALMNGLHARSDRRGDAITMLYAFRQGFYARLGYGSTSSRKRLVFSPRSVPDAWLGLGRGSLRAMRGRDREEMMRLHASAAAQTSGRIERSSRLWDRLVADERRTFLVVDDKAGRGRAPLRGYMSFVLQQDEVHGRTRLVADEVVAADAETRRALFGALGAMRDQVSEIAVEIAETDPLERALVDADGHRAGTSAVEHDLGVIVGGPMVRIEDVPRALAARGYRGTGAFDLVVREPGEADAILAASVRVRDGRAEVGPARGGETLETTRSALGAIFYGGLSPTNAVALGMAVASERLVAQLDPLVAIPPLSAVDSF